MNELAEEHQNPGKFESDPDYYLKRVRELEDALAELVACKDLKAAIHEVTTTREQAAHAAEYDRRKPLAWQRAREVLAAGHFGQDDASKRDRMAQDLQDAIDALVGDRLTALKAADICTRDGYEVTGVVLCRPSDGHHAIVNQSAVRWLTRSQMQGLMHPDNPPAESPLLKLKRAAEAVASQTNPERAYALHDNLIEAIEAVEALRIHEQVGKAVGESRGTLHLYAQARNHDEAYIVGTFAALAALRKTIDAALAGEPARCDAFVADGEGYPVFVLLRPAGAMLQLEYPYTDRVLPDGTRNEWLIGGAVHPGELVG